MSDRRPHPDMVKLSRIEQRFLSLRPDIQRAEMVIGNGEPHLALGADVLISFGPAASDGEHHFYFHAHEDVGFLLSFAARAIRAARERLSPDNRQRQNTAKSEAAGDYAAECAMKCAEPAFRLFLTERHGLTAEASDEDVKVCIRKALDVKSRKKLNTDAEAAKRWRGLCSDFELWRRHG